MCPQNFTDDCYAAAHQAATDLQSFEDNFACLKSSFSGLTAPPNPIAGMWWLDTTAHILKQRNEANNAWLSVWDMANNKPLLANIIVDDIPAAMKDPAAGTAGLRTLGTGAQQAAAGNDSRLATVPDGYVTEVKIAAAAVSQAKLSAYAAGDYLLSANDIARYSLGITYTLKKEIKLGAGGAFRIKFSIKILPTESTTYGKIYRNGGAVGTERSTSSEEYVEYTEDISGWTSGDLLQVYIKSAGTVHTAYACNLRIYVAAAHVPVISLTL